MKTSNSTEITSDATSTSPINTTTETAPVADVPSAIYNEQTIMRLLRIAQEEGRDVFLFRVSSKPSRGCLQVPLLTLVPDAPKRRKPRNAA